MANPSAPSGGQDTPGAKGNQRGAQEKQEKQEKSTQQAPQPGGSGTTTRQSQDDKSGQAPATRQSQGEQPTRSQQQTQSPSTGGKQGAGGQATDTKSGQQGGGSMAGSNVSLTTQQKTTIRNTVINSGPKVTNVDFAVRVGTVVPRTVRVAPLPPTLIEIQPAWRGYMYFVYNDEIIVVEPGSLRIVAVIEV
jgi:Protein of unknown function (DUF1236)